ncbi:MAG: glycoside hydrolase [Methanothrix sp.]|nr:glycoside hydrolase [Methanothrix sp.]
MEKKDCQSVRVELFLMHILFLIVILESVSSGVAASPEVGVWLTTGVDSDTDNKLDPKETLSFEENHKLKSDVINITVDDSTSYQEIEGFGAALTDSSAWLLNEYRKKNPDGYKELMSLLFNKSYVSGKKYGIGIDYVRLPMGASEFVAGDQFYTYDEIENGEKEDLELSHFTIEHDEEYIIPVLQQAISEANNSSRDLKVMASPWTAPTWMKTNKTFFGVIDDNIDVNLNREYYQAYALYFVKFIEEYRRHNITINSITVQNEPQNRDTKKYPGMMMEWNEQADFINNHLGPEFERAGTDAKILIWDHNWDNKEFALNILENLTAASGIEYIAGSAWHGYYGDAKAQIDVYNEYPDKDIYFTERTASGNYEFGTNLQWNCRFVFLPALRNQAKTVLLWNIALDDTFGPHLEGCSDCRGLVNFSQNLESYKFEPEYYVLGHFSKFVDPGAIRINATSEDIDLETIAFQNRVTNNGIVLIVLNPSKTTKDFLVQWRDGHFTYSLGPESIATFEWNGEAIA